MNRVRFCELGFSLGELPAGEQNAITDVAGVRVGHTTLIAGTGPLLPGKGPVRTGVTVILPHGENLFQQKVTAAVYTINGFGKACGFEQVRELGIIEAPIALTNTLNIGLVLDALFQHSIQENPAIGIRTSSVNIVVGETNDGYLNDLQGRHVRAEHVWAALEKAAPGPVQEGSVGAGTGTICFGWKGGIGSASRVLPDALGGFRLGALVQSNFGSAQDLRILGVPIGSLLARPGSVIRPDQGSVIVVLATDAPLDSRQLERLCVRVAAGLARTGSSYHPSSGDFVIAFNTAWRIDHNPASLTTNRRVLENEARVLGGLFQAVVECVEEAVLNSLSCAETIVGRDGHIAYGLPLDQVQELLDRHRVGRN